MTPKNNVNLNSAVVPSNFCDVCEKSFSSKRDFAARMKTLQNQEPKR